MSGQAPSSPTAADPVFEGVYGTYTITAEDRREVRGYRLALTSVAVAQLALALQWHQWGSRWLWPWLVVMVVQVSSSLRPFCSRIFSRYGLRTTNEPERVLWL